MAYRGNASWYTIYDEAQVALILSPEERFLAWLDEVRPEGRRVYANIDWNAPGDLVEDLEHARHLVAEYERMVAADPVMQALRAAWGRGR